MRPNRRLHTRGPVTVQACAKDGHGIKRGVFAFLFLHRRCLRATAGAAIEEAEGDVGEAGEPVTVWTLVFPTADLSPGFISIML